MPTRVYVDPSRPVRRVVSVRELTRTPAIREACRMDYTQEKLRYHGLMDGPIESGDINPRMLLVRVV